MSHSVLSTGSMMQQSWRFDTGMVTALQGVNMSHIICFVRNESTERERNVMTRNFCSLKERNKVQNFVALAGYQTER